MIRSPYASTNAGSLAVWRICLKLAEQESLTKTARSIGTDASHVSKVVSRLEKELGVRLFARTTHSVALTPEGRELLARAEALVAAHNALIRSARRASEMSDLITVTSSALAIQHLVSRWAGEFATLHPGVRFDLQISDTTLKPELEGVDIALLSGRAVTVNDFSIPLGTQPAVVAAAPQYLAQHGAPSTPEDLSKHKLIACNGNMLPEIYRLARGDEIRTLKLAPDIEVESTSLASDLVLGGFGILLHAYEYYFGRFLKEGRLVRVLPEWEVPAIMTSLQLSPSGQRRPLVWRFVEFLRERWSQTPGVTVFENNPRIHWPAG